jgi:hypothetical protein
MNILLGLRHILLVGLLALLGILCAGHAFALCLNDRHPSLAIETESSNFVIIGKVKKATDYTSSDDPTGIAGTKYVVSVLEAFKGNPPKILIVDSENTSSRFPLTVGQRYLLFVQGSATDGFVDSCGNSGVLKERKAEVAELRGTHVKTQPTK